MTTETPKPVEVRQAAERLQAWLDADDATHFGQHEKDIEIVLAALSPTVSEADGLVEAVERHLVWTDNELCDVQEILQRSRNKTAEAALLGVNRAVESLDAARTALRAQPSNEAEPRAFAEQSCSISKTGSTVTIECDEADDANELFDWLSEGRYAASYGKPSNEADGWRDIASAPKNGTVIDLWGAERDRYEPNRVTRCWWENGRWVRLPDVYDDVDCDDGLPVYLATHWRPLPAAPGASVQAGGEVERLRAVCKELLAPLEMAAKELQDRGAALDPEAQAVFARARAALNPEGSDHAR